MNSRTGLYIGFVGYHNLGDEAIWHVCQTVFPDFEWQIFGEEAFQPDTSGFLQRTGRNPSHVLRVLAEELRSQPRLRALAKDGARRLQRKGRGEAGLMGGGTLINRNLNWLRRYAALRQRVGRPVPLFGTAVAAPEFWCLQSGWSDTRKEWAPLLSELPVVGVRGPQSQTLLEDVGLRNVIVCGDPAVLLHRRWNPETETADYRRLRVGLNCGHCQGLLWGDPGRLHACLVEVARRIREAGHEVTLFAVRDTDLDSLQRVAREAALQPSAVAPLLLTHDAFFQHARDFDVVIALKLHAAILAAAASLPFVMLEYEPKCLDFARSIAWERFVIRTNVAEPAKVIELMMELATELPERRRELCAAMCDLAERFRQYCRQLSLILRS
jgi:hypothetical protein